MKYDWYCFVVFNCMKVILGGDGKLVSWFNIYINIG